MDISKPNAAENAMKTLDTIKHVFTVAIGESTMERGLSNDFDRDMCQGVLIELSNIIPTILMNAPDFDKAKELTEYVIEQIDDRYIDIFKAGLNNTYMRNDPYAMEEHMEVLSKHYKISSKLVVALKHHGE